MVQMFGRGKGFRCSHGTSWAVCRIREGPVVLCYLEFSTLGLNNPRCFIYLYFCVTDCQKSPFDMAGVANISGLSFACVHSAEEWL